MASIRMAGRLKTAARANKPHIQYAKETSILKPKPLGVSDSDWPCFVLTDATVYRRDGKTIANPLHCLLEGPMVIKGKLVIDEEDKDTVSKLVNRHQRTANIEITGSDRYSIGYAPTAFWVSGTAGWFEINPSPEYAAMYKEVQEAITLYYSVIMVYEDYQELCEGLSEKNKKKKKTAPPLPPPPTLDDILFQYAITLGNGIFRDEAEARCHKWAQFLIGHFSKELENFACDKTLFARWMRESHPNVAQKIKDANAGLIAPAPIPPVVVPVNIPPDPSPRQNRSAGSSVMSSARNSEDVEMSSDVSTHRKVSIKPTTKPRLVSNTPIPLPSYTQYTIRQAPHSQSPATPELPPRVESEPSSAAEPFSAIDRLIEVFKEGAEDNKTDMRFAEVSKLTQAIYFKCRIKVFATTTKILKYYAKDVLPAFPTEWRGSPAYKWLEKMASEPRRLPEGMTVDGLASQLERRKQKLKQQPVFRPPAIEPRPRARKSTRDSDDEQPPPQGKRPPVVGVRKSGKGAVLRPTASKKRPASLMDDDGDDGMVDGTRPGKKLSKRNRGTVEDHSDADDDDDGEVTLTSSQIPKVAVRVVVHSERLPTLSPSGPNGTWVCDQDGCGHVVREAEDQAGQELIKSHFEWHQKQVEKINLAMAESRGHMPINHLLDKLQELGKKTLQKKLENGVPPSKVLPIKRKLLI
ncbi:hypothetical protein V8F06_001305 [Rhypophila decipiens]